jgi:thiosulfate reductase cytochrome b subunit
MAMADKARVETVLVPRHSALTRLTHWLNVLALALLLMSGLQIFNAHPALYWGATSNFERPWLSMSMSTREADDAPRGITTLGPYRFDTTGLFGWSGEAGMREKRGFPRWATLPSYRSLADGRRWHFFFAWVFAVNGLVYLGWSLAGGHVRRDLLPTREQLSPGHLRREIASHARLRFPKGEAARRYNALQKLAYLAVIFVLLPLMLLTGLTMSPGFDAAVPQLLDLFGGRQSARSIHFISAGLIVLFVLTHLFMVAASGAWNNIRSMITGRYAIRTQGDGA